MHQFVFVAQVQFGCIVADGAVELLTEGVEHMCRRPRATFAAQIGHFLEDGRAQVCVCLLYTSDAAAERSSVDLGGCRILKKKNKIE